MPARSSPVPEYQTPHDALTGNEAKVTGVLTACRIITLDPDSAIIDPNDALHDQQVWALRVAQQGYRARLAG